MIVLKFCGQPRGVRSLASVLESVSEDCFLDSAAAMKSVSTPEKQKCNLLEGASPVSSTTDGISSSGCSPFAARSSASDSSVVPCTIDFEEGTAADDVENATPAPLTQLANGLLVNTQADETHVRVYWEAFLVVVPVFSGYAALFGLQHHIKSRFGIKDNSSSASHDFGFAVSFLYIFNLIFRFAHNILFAPLTPRGRVFVAMTSMMLSMLIIGVVIMMLESYRMTWVVLAYSLGGVAVGSFESNLLACLTPLGHRTKHIAIMGIPVGITTVLVGAFFILGPPFSVPVAFVYVGVAIAVACGMLVMALRIPTEIAAGTHDCVKGQMGLRKFASDLKHFKTWLPQIWHYPFAFTLDMFCLSCFSPGVALYIYDSKTIALSNAIAVQNDTFFAIFNIFNMLGGLLGRYLSYRVKARHPAFYVCLHIVGVALLLSRVPSLAPLSTLFIMLGDGLIYGSLSRRIDMHVPMEFNLTAISYWLFVGDLGSILGSNLISYIRDWVAGG
jgi:hypothetical protein